MPSKVRSPFFCFIAGPEIPAASLHVPRAISKRLFFPSTISHAFHQLLTHERQSYGGLWIRFGAAFVHGMTLNVAIGLALAYGLICACKLRILTAQGDQLSYLHAPARAFSKLISLFTCLIGFIIAAFHSDKRGFHDRICGTRGVRQEAQG